ncbi:hypothetical protein GCM10009555_017880 [Acrocarpospora macrocephala]|uniref:HTH cro/C1-type domain-containing protein n=1 Tax=Acrocarpospora macrocephala TaxID=150177 RepID=A0A5M3WMA1_9ACTN|nr:helix-turn-helix transcriptional regulator [Acrocarpospora macrocephala]GES07448.1 hypothetical protein Amac_010430 [Acrocarpospora macrocephala]
MSAERAEVAPAARVRQLFEERGLTAAEFAVLADLDPGVIEGGLSGTRSFTSLDLALIAEAHGVTVGWLLGDDRVAPTSVYRRQRDEQAETEQLRAKVAAYESAICWETTCTGCARLLGQCRAAEERAERAEAERDQLRAAVQSAAGAYVEAHGTCGCASAECLLVARLLAALAEGKPATPATRPSQAASATSAPRDDLTDVAGSGTGTGDLSAAQTGSSAPVPTTQPDPPGDGS